MKWEVKRQPNSKQWGVYRDGALVEGGFFDRTAAESARDEHRSDIALREPSPEAKGGFGAREREAVEALWLARAQAQGYKAGTRTYRNAEVEFFTGAIAALEVLFPRGALDTMSDEVPISWVLKITTGRPVADARREG